MIRQALEETFGASILPNSERVETSLQECELFAKAIYGLRSTSPMPDTHTITKAEIVKLRGDTYGVRFEFDDGTIVQEPVGPKATAEFYAREQMGESIPVGVNPLLLSAEKAEKLRGISGIR
jgi:hypothetical protein